MLSTIIISKIQESCIHLFLKNNSVNFWIFHSNNFIFLKTFNSKFSYIEVWFVTDENSKPLQTEDKINIMLVIN